MFAMGLTLKFADFKRILLQPHAVFIGLSVQIILLPLAAFALLQSGQVSPVFSVGIMILAASPGGITSNLLTHMARGDTALSVTMTAINSLLGMITVPFIVSASLAYFLPAQEAYDLSVAKMITGVFVVSTAPVLMGVFINQWRPHLAERMERMAGPLSVGIFMLVVLGAFASSWQVMIENIFIIGPIMLALNVLIMVAGWGLARGSFLTKPQATAIALEGGLQNGALGIFVAVTLLHNKTLMIPSITYALIMNITAAMLIIWRLQKASVRAG